MTAPNARRRKRKRIKAERETLQQRRARAATPETAARLTPDPLLRLARSVLTGRQHDAALDIRQAFELRHGPTVKLANMERIDNPGQYGAETDKNVDLQLQFNHWYRAMLERNWGVLHILRVLINGDSLTEAAHLYNMDRRKQRRFFIKGLQLFVLIQAGRIRVVDKNAPAAV